MLEQIPMLYIQLLILVILLGLSGFFSSYETAITSLSKIQIRQLVKQRKKNSELVQKLRDNLNDTIITILIGNNLVNIGASALATVVATDVFGSSGVGMAIGLLTFFVLIFGEITPKAYATQNAEKQALQFAKLFLFLSSMLRPVIWILSRVSNAMIRMIGGQVGDEPLVTKEAITSIADIGAEEGVLAESEKNLIHNVVQFNSTTTKNIMTPRTKVSMLDVKDSLTKIKRTVAESHHSRIPIYEGDKDHIIGILHVTKFLKEYSATLKIRSILNPAYFVTSEQPIDKLLRQIQTNRAPMAIVLDANGGFAGVVTLEDVMEELIGDFYDETDINQHLLKHIDKKTVDADADMSIKNVDSALKISLPDEKKTTFGSLNEFILNKLGHIPKTGEELALKDVVITIKKATKHKIDVVRIRKK
jgi:putative hemolysin